MPWFPAPKDVLAPAQGALEETPFALLLHALGVEQRSVTLELERGSLHKHIHFEDGAPISCSSNLLHETLGRFLVDQGKLEDQQWQTLLAECASSGQRMGEMMVQRGLLSPYDLFRALQRNLAMRILDAFRWTKGTWKLNSGDDPGLTPLKMNAAKLLITGCTTTAPLEVITAGFPFGVDQRFAALPEPPLDLELLKLAGKELRLLKALEKRPTVRELEAAARLLKEDVIRRLYAFGLMGVVTTSEEVHEVVVSPPPPPKVEEAPAAQPAVASMSKQEIIRLFLRYTSLDPFDLLGVPEKADFSVIKAAYLAHAQRLAPWTLKESLEQEVVDKAELLFLAGARAYSELADPARRAEIVKRRHANSPRSPSKSSPDFTIRTDLIDGSKQFEKGRKLLLGGRHKAALEQLSYAVEIDPRPLHRAWAAWARYTIDPTFAKIALSEVEAAFAEHPRCVDAILFAGRIRQAMGDRKGARDSLKQAAHLAPHRADVKEALAALG